MSTERNQSLDALKYLLILFVVIGHFIQPCRYENIGMGLLYSVIYSFHMPLFVFLSGYFFKCRNLKEELRKCLPLFEVCILSHLAYTLLSYGGISLKSLFSFTYSPAWYLVSLIFWRIASCILFQKLNAKQVFFLCIAVEVVTFCLVIRYGGLLAFMRTCQFYPYFVFGYLLKGKLQVLNRYRFVIATLGALSIIFILLTSSRLQHVIFFRRDGLVPLSRLYDHSLLWMCGYRYLLLFCSLSVSSLLLMLTYKNTFIQMVARYGQGTLFIYFGQTVLYPIVVRYVTDYRLSLCVSLITIVILTYISLTPISKYLMNPICTVWKKIKPDTCRL